MNREFREHLMWVATDMKNEGLYDEKSWNQLMLTILSFTDSNLQGICYK